MIIMYLLLGEVPGNNYLAEEVVDRREADQRSHSLEGAATEPGDSKKRKINYGKWLINYATPVLNLHTFMWPLDLLCNWLIISQHIIKYAYLGIFWRIAVALERLIKYHVRT